MTGRKVLAVTACAALVAFCLGAAAAGEPETQTRVEERVVTREVPVTKTVEKTPASCKTALDIDNQIFTKVGTALQTMEFTEANAYMESVQAKRTANYGDCISR
jgi:ABC-type glycerol-3-phosphate transport system substrate-binding protein